MSLSNGRWAFFSNLLIVADETQAVPVATFTVCVIIFTVPATDVDTPQAIIFPASLLKFAEFQPDTAFEQESSIWHACC
jgi:hypothetical protein